MRGVDDIGTIQQILLNKQQLVTGARDYIFQLPYSRYNYCEYNAVTFLWDKLPAHNIKLGIQGAWRSTVTHATNTCIMEYFIDKGYPY